MASLLKNLVKCCFGPALFRIHGRQGRVGDVYKPNAVEFGSDKVVSTISMCWSLSYWLSPIVITVLYRRGYFSGWDGASSLLKITIIISVVYCAACFTRGIGRFGNADYVKFLEVFAIKDKSTKANLSLYDFDFSFWPTNFLSDSRVVSKEVIEEEALWTRLINLPRNFIAYTIIHSFGRGMIYPGSTSLVNSMLFHTLVEYRGKLIEEKNAIRAKVSTSETEYVDTIFVNRRENTSNGYTLVLTCEGNAAFYEIGCMTTPLDAGYSVLGWNRPGFSQSSGKPNMDAELQAADSVMQYAINSLGFAPENIMLFSWSIGGFDATYLASIYPDVKALILDATFDDIIPLAINRMPAFASSIIEYSIRRHINLHITPLIKQYDGPVLLIRRTKDEMITVGESAPLESNRGNYLLIELLRHRYPKLVDDNGLALLHRYIAHSRLLQRELLNETGVEPDTCLITLKSYAEVHSTQFPLNIGEDLDEVTRHQLLLYLAFHHMIDFDSTHCTPLPVSKFSLPWTLNISQTTQ